MVNYSKQILQNIADSKFNNQDLINKAIVSDSENELINLAESLIIQGFIDDAKGILEHLNEKDDTNDQINLDLAEIYLDEGNDDQSLNCLDKIEQKAPLYLSAQIVKADLYESEGLAESAEGVLLDLQNISDDPIIRFALAEFYDAEGENGKSAQLYDYLLNQGHESINQINLHARLAMALASNGEFEESIAEFQKVGLKNLSGKEISSLAQAYLQSGDREKSQQLIEENIDNQEAELDDYLNLASIYEKQGNSKEQLRTLQLAKSFDPFNLLTRFKLALLQSNLGDYVSSNKELNFISEKDPSQTNAISLLAYNFLQEKEYSQAINLINEHIEDDEIDQHYFWYLGLAYFNSDQQKQAENAFEQVDEYFSKEPSFLKDAFFVFKNTNIDTAQNYLKKYLRIVPEDFEMESYLI
ncbi:tetratricopeptide repeat protein [Oenococcus sp. UCMA 16435]|nr:tetratricopeptide repeat protein [Oenococcus sp. UCMA 16435]MDI4583996.1 tetratricopeptide repeat protein [Oenococcus sp. UCMA 14587]